MFQPCVYILLCADDSYYVGCTSNLPQRIEEHATKHYCGYTSTRLPVRLVYSQEFVTMELAIQAEKQLKGWSRAKKEALIRNEFERLPELSKNRINKGSK